MRSLRNQKFLRSALCETSLTQSFNSNSFFLENRIIYKFIRIYYNYTLRKGGQVVKAIGCNPMIVGSTPTLSFFLEFHHYTFTAKS